MRLLFLSCTFALASCGATLPDYSAQFCANNVETLQKFHREFQGWAKHEDLQFFDESASIQKDLEAIEAEEPFPIFSLHAHNDENVEILVGNAGLGPFEIHASIFSNGNQAVERKFRQFMEGIWQATPVSNEGTKPFGNCPESLDPKIYDERVS